MGIFFVTNFFSKKFKISPCIRLKTWKYNACGIKLEMKVMRLHKIHLELISSFLLNKCVVHDFRLLPDMFQVQPV